MSSYISASVKEKFPILAEDPETLSVQDLKTYRDLKAVFDTAFADGKEQELMRARKEREALANKRSIAFMHKNGRSSQQIAQLLELDEDVVSQVIKES